MVKSMKWQRLALLGVALLIAASPAFAAEAPSPSLTGVKAQVMSLVSETARAESIQQEIEKFVTSWVVAVTNQDGNVMEIGLDALFDEKVAPMLSKSGLDRNLLEIKSLTTSWATMELERQLAH